MRRTVLLIGALLLSASAGADELAPAAAAPARLDDTSACNRVREPGLVDGPVILGLYDADFATGRSACVRSELAVYERFGATIDTPNFYGGIRLDTIVSGSYRLRHNIALFGAIELVHWELAQNATIKAIALGLGQATLGLQGLAYESRHFAISAYGRVLVPTASWPTSAQTAGAELGLAALYRPRRDLELHGQLEADFTAGLTAIPQFRGGTTLMLGLQYAPARWFALAIDLAAVLGHRAALDAFLPSLGLRFRVWRALNLELDATLPLAGADRRLAIGALRIAYRY